MPFLRVFIVSQTKSNLIESDQSQQQPGLLILERPTVSELVYETTEEKYKKRKWYDYYYMSLSTEYNSSSRIQSLRKSSPSEKQDVQNCHCS